MNRRTTIVVCLAIAAILTGCGRRSGSVTSTAKPTSTAVTVKPAIEITYGSPDPLSSGLHFAPSVRYETMQEENARIVPAVADYTVAPDLSNVVNLKIFRSLLGPEQIKAIAANNFVVTPADYTQMFHVYENNSYFRPEMAPSFITTDSMLHTYHVFYDYSLREVETGKLFDAAVKLTDAMLAASENDLAKARDPSVKDAARQTAAYFAVARQLLKGTSPPENAKGPALKDLSKIESHEGKAISAVLGVTIDFSQFVPRGHYTRSEKLKKYFKAMMWYGLSPMPVPNPDGYGDSEKKIGLRPTRMALLVVRNLRSVRYQGQPALKLWDMIYEPTAFYVGTADDYTVYDYARLSDKVYGKAPSMEAFAGEPKLQEFVAEVKKLKGPGIENYGGEDEYAATGRQFRFMGQRFIPDSRILQELTHPKVVGRKFPMGLDVFASLGSDRALSIVKAQAYAGYDAQLAKMRAEMKETSNETWQSNLYYGWIWSLQSLIGSVPQGYPAFMRTEAWTDKSLTCGLGSWTELRHDTILYAKQSATTECGGAEEEKEPKTPKGYVEPNLEFWTKLMWLNEYTRQGLGGRGLLTEELKDKFAKLGDWLDFCRRITIKELTNKKVTEEEYDQISIYGAELEELTLSFAGGEVLSDADEDMALIADVHTYENTCLEEGTGRAGAIYVVVPIEGKLYLTRGAVYTHYEFEHPAADRLTDEKWQEMLNSVNTKPMAPWTRSFFVNGGKKPEMVFGIETGGC